MLKARFIPTILISDGRVIKTRGFQNPVHIGDPVNAVTVFSELGADEILVLDIDVSRQKSSPSFALLERLARQTSVPIGYGGGIRTVDDAINIIRLGFEKIIINSAAVSDPSLITKVSDILGSQAVVGGIDVLTNKNTYEVVINSGTSLTGMVARSHAENLVALGCGELFVNNIQRDGCWTGYDLQLTKEIAETVAVPLICCGGAGSYSDLVLAIEKGRVSAAASGSLMLFKGEGEGVVLNYPDWNTLPRLNVVGTSKVNHE
ncbi:HisA/HisF-related TIM barrel protein [Rhodospirillales bacterium]|nr:HisA/HisF-related TIM barrel protein [Rhodospirillales bacterium]